ncbi:MAG TPA: HD domain-containing phosphohydrolase [Pirellulales bacterium]|nr:HD domain-containing phosphohydrolase [Pirellulales bacterium]
MYPLSHTASAATIDPTAIAERAAAPGVLQPWSSVLAPEVSADLERWFCTGFSLIDGQTGEPVELSADHGRIDWLMRGALCREVAQRGGPEIIEEDGPCLLLAIPFTSEKRSLVAVGAFLTRQAVDGADVNRVANMLGLNATAAEDWIAEQKAIDANVLERLAAVACEKLAGDDQIDELENEVEKLSSNLGATFEEISLLYRLTHNLKLSSNDEELGQRALEWLSEVLPAECFLLQLVAGTTADMPAADARTEPVLLSYGDCDLTAADFSSLVSELGLRSGSRPVVLNHVRQEEFGWRYSGVRELVIVPVAEGERLFGWLAIVNHATGGEFGTAEASLLSSVGAMLGIHSGNIDLYRQQAELFVGVVKAMSSAIDAKDPYTRGHSDRVARVAVRLAQELGCDSETLKTIYFSGLLHDIGKIGVNEDVLRKPGKLTEAEFEHIKTHVIVGYRILADLKNVSHMLPVVLHHHEAWDGSGYPHGLAREDIPYLARIVAVADSYDAMASDRPYRPGMEDERLDQIIRSGAGQQWDPKIVEAFFRAREDIRAISGRGPEISQPVEQNWL